MFSPFFLSKCMDHNGQAENGQTIAELLETGVLDRLIYKR